MSDTENTGRFQPGNTAAKGTKRKKGNDHVWTPVVGSTPQQVIDKNATDFLNWCFAEAKDGNGRIQEALLKKLMPDKAVRMGEGNTLPDFEKHDLLELHEMMDELEDD